MASLHGYTNAWDSVLPRLQEALYGEFVISRELGRGGMSAVFLAHQLRLDRKVAIKVMAPTLMTGVGLAERFRDEATTVARLDHPNIISIFEIGSAANLQYFVMQYVPGRSLERATRQHGPLAFDVVRAIVFEVGAALAHAHRHQVIHRDVKPGNILLSLDGRVIVSDFGIAKVTAASARTQTGAVIGTPAYMSPEQCYGLPLTWRADQYSLGVVAYELVTGVQPFAGSSYEVMRRHTEDPVPPVAAHRPDCPPDVAGAIERMLAKRPEDRFASMAEAGAAMGATRTRIGEAVQEAIGRLAIPTLDEEGVVLVHTPASPAPERHPSGPAPPTAPSPAAARSEPMAIPRAVALEALARAKRAARNLRGVSARSVHAVGTVVRLVQVLSIGAARQARASRSALGVVAAIGIALAATGAILLVRKAVLERTGLTPRSRSEPSLGAIAARRDSSRGAREIMAGETERDSFAADSLVPDSVAADSVVAAADTVVAGLRIRSRPSIVVGDSLQMAATALDIHGNRLRRHTVYVAGELQHRDDRFRDRAAPRAGGRTREGLRHGRHRGEVHDGHRNRAPTPRGGR